MCIACGHTLSLLAVSLCEFWLVTAEDFRADDVVSEDGRWDSEDLTKHRSKENGGDSPSGDCPETQVWKPCACMHSICGSGPIACARECIPGCMCPPGKYLDVDTQRCVDPWKCPFGACIDNALFVDRHKRTCADWTTQAVACDKATDIGYTTAEQETLLTECKTSCGSCGKIFGVDVVIGPDYDLFEFSALVVHSPTALFVANYNMNEVRAYFRGSNTVPFANKTRLAGSGQRGEELHELDARLSCGLAVDPRNQDVYIAEWRNSRVVKWARDAAKGIVVAGGNGKGPGLHQVKAPAGVAVDWETDDVFVSEYGNSRVTKWAPHASTGVVVAGHPDAQFSRHLDGLWHPKGIALFGGYVYIADWGNSRVVKWLMDGSTVEGIHVAGANPVASPPLNSGVQQLHQLLQPKSVFVDDDGTVYVCDTGNHRIMHWDVGATEGVRVAGVGQAGDGQLQLSGPSAVWRDKASGDIYVVDSDNMRVVQWRELGQKRVLAIHSGKDGDRGAGPLIAAAQASPDHEPKVLSARRNEVSANQIQTILGAEEL